MEWRSGDKQKKLGQRRERKTKKKTCWEKSEMRKNSHPSSAIFSAGFLVEESGSELPVKQNHYTVNFQSIFIQPLCKKPYW